MAKVLNGWVMLGNDQAVRPDSVRWHEADGQLFAVLRRGSEMLEVLAGHEAAALRQQIVSGAVVLTGLMAERAKVGIALAG